MSHLVAKRSAVRAVAVVASAKQVGGVANSKTRHTVLQRVEFGSQDSTFGALAHTMRGGSASLWEQVHSNPSPRLL